MVRLDQPVLLDPLEIRALLALLARLAQPVLSERPVHKATLALLAHSDR